MCKIKTCLEKCSGNVIENYKIVMCMYMVQAATIFERGKPRENINIYYLNGGNSIMKAIIIN